MPNTIAEAFAPATAANLGVGFDILGLALHQPGDVVRARLTDTPDVVIERIEGDGGRLPRETELNTAGVAAQSTLRKIGASQGVALSVYKHLPLGSGLGSSASSAVAAAVAVNALFGEPLSREELLDPILDGEAVASGRHPDNVGPSLFGGITLFTFPTPEGLTRLPVPDNLYLALVTPDIEVKTAEARAILPKDVPLASMIRQTAAVAVLIDALYRRDIRALGRAMESDRVVEPARQHLMPHFMEIREAAHAAGAHGLVISGAGPTLLAVCDNPRTAIAVKDVMQAVYSEHRIESQGYHDTVCTEGARVLSVE